ncbi:hypothetical protein BJP25_11535 [Actinokineospora bangkokensis]|uniref:Uncharacterized protein n=1 Tax=Actinokineospora bangkokensis TaxID=1193682 RepID=A0A1Q9LQR3_9PSEU|nr:hypothetical protein BJP25_11535 [Actinokineospora bangkokensis]
MRVGLVVPVVVAVVGAVGVVTIANAAREDAAGSAAIAISEETGLSELVVYKGAKPSEYATLMARPDRVRGDIHDGDFYGLMGVSSPARAAGASISAVSYDNGVSDDEGAQPDSEDDCPDRPAAHCLPEETELPEVDGPDEAGGPDEDEAPEDEAQEDGGADERSSCPGGCRRYVTVAEAGGIVKYTVPGPLDLITVEHPADTDPSEVAKAVKAEYGIDQGKNLVAELHRDGRHKALRLRATTANGSVREDLVVPWQFTEDSSKPVKVESARAFDGIANYESGRPGPEPSWTQAAELKRAAECERADGDRLVSAFCSLSQDQLDQAVADAQATAHQVIDDPRSFELPELAKGQVLSEQELAALANGVAQDVAAANSGGERAIVPAYVTRALSKAIPAIAEHGHDAFLKVSAVEGVLTEGNGALAKVTSVVGPVPVLGSLAGIVNEAVGISADDPPAAIAQKALEIAKNVAGVALTVMAIAFPPFAPVAALATAAWEVGAALGKYLLGFLLPDPPDPREAPYQQNQAQLTAAGVQAQWEYERYGTVQANRKGANVTQSLVLQPTAGNKAAGIALGGFDDVGYRQFYLRTEAVRVYRDGVRDVDLTCEFDESGYGSDTCTSPIPLLATRDHPLRVEFSYTSQGPCGSGTVCRNRDASMDLVRPGEPALPLYYTVYG